LISKILVGREISEVVENAGESSFGEGQDVIESILPRARWTHNSFGTVIRKCGAGKSKRCYELIL
jgi:hypothetical protein